LRVVMSELTDINYSKRKKSFFPLELAW